MRSSLACALGSLAFASALSATGCHRAGNSNATDDSAVVATIGDTKLTVSDVERLVNAKPPYLRRRYAKPEKLKELVDETVRFEALAEQAKRRGYDKDPDVVRAMKQQMIAKLMQNDFEAKHGPDQVSDADVARYYSEHSAEFNGAEEVRVSEISAHDESKAKKAYAEAKAHAGPAGADLNAFRTLVATYSEDEATKQRGGDLGFVSRATTAVPKPVVDAAFGLSTVGDVSEPVGVDGGWVVLLLTQKRPGFVKTLAEAKDEIRMRLSRESHDKALVAFVADLQKSVGVQLHQENLDKVRIAEGDSAQRMAESVGSTPRGN
jgi:parvulin-like peptidyl-prolyl isomerase